MVKENKMTEIKMTVEEEKKAARDAVTLAVAMASAAGYACDPHSVAEIAGACVDLVSGLIDDREAAKGTLTQRQTEILRLADEIREARGMAKAKNSGAMTALEIDLGPVHKALDLTNSLIDAVLKEDNA